MHVLGNWPRTSSAVRTTRPVPHMASTLRESSRMVRLFELGVFEPINLKKDYFNQCSPFLCLFDGIFFIHFVTFKWYYLDWCAVCMLVPSCMCWTLRLIVKSICRLRYKRLDPIIGRITRELDVIVEEYVCSWLGNTGNGVGEARAEGLIHSCQWQHLLEASPAKTHFLLNKPALLQITFSFFFYKYLSTFVYISLCIHFILRTPFSKIVGFEYKITSKARPSNYV